MRSGAAGLCQTAEGGCPYMELGRWADAAPRFIILPYLPYAALAARGLRWKVYPS